MNSKKQINNQKYRTTRRGVVLYFWCGRWDLNPYACAHAPQTCLSANSSTAAHRVLYDGRRKKSTPNFTVSESFSCIISFFLL